MNVGATLGAGVGAHVGSLLDVGSLLAVGKLVGTNVGVLDGTALRVVGNGVPNTTSNVGCGVSTLPPCATGEALGDSEALGMTDEVGSTGDSLGGALGLRNGARDGTGD